ncbi:MAG: AMP-binding protein [Betaproteobacteria bacterium]
MFMKSPGAKAPQVAADLLPLQRLYHCERNFPAHVVLTQPHDGGQVRETTWKEVADQTRRVARFLLAQGWPKGSRIAILGKNSAEWLIADFAIWMAGHVSVPLYPMQTADNVRQTIGHCGALACFVGKLDEISLLQGIDAGVLTIALPLAPAGVIASSAADWPDVLTQHEPLQGDVVRAGGELASIMYTSGTTGQGKGVMHSFKTLTAICLATQSAVAQPIGGSMLSYLPLAHAMERSSVEIGILHRADWHVYFVESLATFANDLRRARPTLFVSVPRLWQKLQQGVLASVPQHKLSRLLKVPVLRGIVKRKVLRGLGLERARYCVSGSAPLSMETIQWFAALGLPIAEGYGMTEVANASHIGRPGDLHFGTVGPPIPGVEQRIDPATDEVQLLSPGATLGYYLEPQLTQELFTADGWLRTGDTGVIDANGCLRIVGRIKDNFKSSKGKYVAPAPIEHKLSQHTAVETCIVIGANLPQPIAVVVLSDVARASLPAAQSQLGEDFSAHLKRINASLDPHERLDYLVLTTLPWTVEGGLLTPTMKARRPRIEAVYATSVPIWTAAGNPVVWAEASF